MNDSGAMLTSRTRADHSMADFPDIQRGFACCSRVRWAPRARPLCGTAQEHSAHAHAQACADAEILLKRRGLARAGQTGTGTALQPTVMKTESASPATPTTPPGATRAHTALPRPFVLKYREDLLARSRISAGEFHSAIRFAEQQQVSLADALVALSYVPEQTAYEALSRRWVFRSSTSMRCT